MKKRYLLSLLVLVLFAIGFSASGSDSGTYHLENGYTLKIDDEEVVRLTTPNGQTYSGHYTDAPWGKYVTFTEYIEIKNVRSEMWYFDDDFQFFYSDYTARDAKDESKRLKVLSKE